MSKDLKIGVRRKSFLRGLARRVHVELRSLPRARGFLGGIPGALSDRVCVARLAGQVEVFTLGAKQTRALPRQARTYRRGTDVVKVRPDSAPGSDQIGHRQAYSREKAVACGL